MSVNVLSAPSSLSAVGNESQLDSAVHNLYTLYHTSSHRSTSATSRHHRSDSRTISTEDDFMISYGQNNPHSIAQAQPVRAKLSRLPPPKRPDSMDEELMELIRNTAANARLSLPVLTDSSIRRKPKIHDRIVSFCDSPEYIITTVSSDSDDANDDASLEDLSNKEEAAAVTPPPSPTKRAVRTLRDTAKAVVRGKPVDHDGKLPKEGRSRPVSAPPALSSDTQRHNHTLKTIGKWLTDKNKWLNVDRNFLY